MSGAPDCGMSLCLYKGNGIGGEVRVSGPCRCDDCRRCGAPQQEIVRLRAEVARLTELERAAFEKLISQTGAVATAVAAEREACARVAETLDGGGVEARFIAQEIRARGDK